MYDGKNCDGSSVIVLLEKRKEMTVQTLQSNGWWVVHEYDDIGDLVGETFTK